MDLPPELLRAASSPAGGMIALVIGAGCSVEPPTGVPVASECSLRIYKLLIDDGVLQVGDCADPSDLSLVADAVYNKRESQRDVVDRLLAHFDLKLASPNDGYLIAAAMLSEGVISSVVTLNFDLALSHAISQLGVGRNIGVVESPADLPKQQNINIYYLHRNANAADPESWVLRSGALTEDWRGHWEAIIATKVLAAPVIVFAGLGTPVAVLIESVRLLRHALPNDATLYQVDPGERAGSRFFQALEIDASAYLQCDWGQLMDQLAERLTIAQVDQIGGAANQKLREDALHAEDVGPLLTRLRSLGLVKLGKLRAHWLLHEKPYSPVEASTPGLIADLILALATVVRVSGAEGIILEDGLVQFIRDGRVVASYVIASGSGHRGRAAIEARVRPQSRRFRSLPTPPNGVIVGGTSDAWDTELTPPEDILRGYEDEQNPFPFLHVSQLRSDDGLIQQAVP